MPSGRGGGRIDMNELTPRHAESTQPRVGEIDTETQPVAVGIVEINKGHPNENASLTLTQFTAARESPTITCLWQRRNGRQGSREAV